MTAPQMQPHPQPRAADGLSRIPLLPTIAGVLVVLGLIGGLAGGCGGSGPSARGYTTSTSELCSSYRAVFRSFDDYTDTDIGDELDALVSAAKNYDDSGVRSDGEKIDSYSGPLISESRVRSDSRNIAAECR